MSFFYPVPTFQEDVSHRLWSAATLALVGVGLLDGVEVDTKADLACAHLCDHRANRFMCANMCVDQSSALGPRFWLTNRPGLKDYFRRIKSPTVSTGTLLQWNKRAFEIEKMQL